MPQTRNGPQAGASHVTGATAPPPALNLNDEAILLEIDLQKQDELLRFFPLKRGCGQDEVPLHICGYDTDYKKTFWKICEFRGMSKKEQEIEKNWGKASCKKKTERRLYETRINKMMETKAQIQARNGTYYRQPPANRASIVSPPPTQNTAASTLMTDLNQEESAASAPPPMALRSGVPPGNTRRPEPTTHTTRQSSGSAAQQRTQQQQQQDESEEEQEPEQQQPNQQQQQPSNQQQPANQQQQSGRQQQQSSDRQQQSGQQQQRQQRRQQQQQQQGSDEAQGQGTNKRAYGGKYKSQAARNALARDLEPTKNKKRKVGSFAPHPSLLACSPTMDQIHMAMKKFASAMDMAHCPDNANGPKHRFVVLITCDVKETNINGGQLTKYHRGSTKITLPSRSKKDTKKVLESFCEAYKHRRPVAGYDKVTLHASDPKNGSMYEVVDKYVKDYNKDSGSGPRYSTLDHTQIELNHQVNTLPLT